MPAEEYKALTVVHLPYVGPNGKTFLPGKTIKLSDFEKNAEGAADYAAKNPDAEAALSADEQISYFEEWGTVSADLDAELHPDHRPVDPNAPTLARMIEQAKQLIDIHKERGLEVPADLQNLADLDYQHLNGGTETGSSSETHNATGGDE